MGIEIFTDIYNKGSLANVLSKHIKFYREHPDVAAYDLFKYDLVVHQRPVFRDMHHKQFIMDIETRGGSKTSKLALFGVTRGILYSGQRIGVLGPSFRQSKNIFDYAESIIEGAQPFIKDSLHRFYRGTDAYRIEWRNERGPKSMMEGLPIGDGSKIRGARYFVIMVDEVPHIPRDIHDTIIVPMGTVHINPALRVREMKRIKSLSPEQQRLERLAMQRQDAITGNKIIYCTTAYFQWNWFYEMYKTYRTKQLEGDPRYCLWEIPYYDIPEGFMDEENLEYSRSTAPVAIFQMERECKWLSDTDGFYPASLVESIQVDSGFTVRLTGKRDRVYILAVDPASKIDFFSMIVIEISDGELRVVYASSQQGISHPDMTRKIRELDKYFNFSIIAMDAGGGGNAIYDNLFTHETDPWCEYEGNCNPKGADRNKKSGRLIGRKVLAMTDFTSEWLEKANFSLKSSMEKKTIFLPEPIKAKSFPEEGKGFIEEEKIDAVIAELKLQLISIEMHHTATKGTLTFKPPKKNAHDDLFSALLMGHKTAFDQFIAPADVIETPDNTTGFYQTDDGASYSASPEESCSYGGAVEF